MKKTLLTTLPLICAFNAMAQAQPITPLPAETWHAHTLGQALANSVLFGLLGIFMVLIGAKIFDKTVTRINLEQEILKGNVAAAILSGSAIIAIGLIIAASIG